MSPPPVRDDTNARYLPSGEKSGRRSYELSATSSRASPPAMGTDQISPPDVNAISRPSGEIPGSANAYLGGTSGDCPAISNPEPTTASDATRKGVRARMGR